MLTANLFRFICNPTLVRTLRKYQRLRAIALKENNPNVALRVSVESGGCHGYQYKIDLSNLSDGAGD